MAKIPLSPGRILPRDMDEREWSRWAMQQTTTAYRSGQTGYNTGTGFFIGDDNGVPKLSLGVPNVAGITWNGSTFSIYGNFTWTDISPDEVTPNTWDGFSVDPTGSFYMKSLSGLTFLTSEIEMSGTSDQVYFTFDVDEFDPAISLGGIVTTPFRAIDNGTDVLAVAEIANTGTFVCSKFNGTTFDPNGWTNSGTKGIPKLTTLSFYYPSHLWA